MITKTLKSFEITVNDQTPVAVTELLNVPEAKIMLNFKPI